MKYVNNISLSLHSSTPIASYHPSSLARSQVSSCGYWVSSKASSSGSLGYIISDIGSGRVSVCMTMASALALGEARSFTCRIHWLLAPNPTAYASENAQYKNLRIEFSSLGSALPPESVGIADRHFSPPVAPFPGFCVAGVRITPCRWLLVLKSRLLPSLLQSMQVSGMKLRKLRSNLLPSLYASCRCRLLNPIHDMHWPLLVHPFSKGHTR